MTLVLGIFARKAKVWNIHFRNSLRVLSEFEAIRISCLRYFTALRRVSRYHALTMYLIASESADLPSQPRLCSRFRAASRVDVREVACLQVHRGTTGVLSRFFVHKTRLPLATRHQLYRIVSMRDVKAIADYNFQTRKL